MKPAPDKARALLGKLERLADPANGGTLDEIAAARHKMDRLKARFDFSTGSSSETKDIFTHVRSERILNRAVKVHRFERSDVEVANAVKWAIEQATGIPCVFRGEDLMARTAAGTAKRLAKVAAHIAQSFHTLLERFGRLHGVTAADRRLFVRGLYDGMMNDIRGAGERLPGGPVLNGKLAKAKKGVADSSPRLAVHPYTVALGLGRQVRFAASLESLTAELDRATQPALAPGHVHSAGPPHLTDSTGQS